MPDNYNQLPIKYHYGFRGVLALLIVALASLGGYVYYGTSHAATVPPTDQFTLKDTTSGKSITGTNLNGTQNLGVTVGDSLTITNYQSANVTGSCASYGIAPWGSSSGAVTRPKNVSAVGPNLPASATATAPATIGLEFDCTSSVGAHYTSKIYFTVNPVPQPQPTPIPTPIPKPQPKPTNTTSKTPVAPAKDTAAPTAPGNFLATLDGAVIGLTWDASTDNTSVAGYNVDRSLDQTVWTALSAKQTTLTYNDTTAGYGATYYYRLNAIDAAGNASGYVYAQVSTGSFQPTADSSTIKSDDNVVSVSIPAGALTDKADCSVAVDSNHGDKLPLKKVALVAGPYSLLCKKSDGSSVDSFSSPVSITVKLTADQTKHYRGFNFYAYNSDGDSWSKFKVTYNKKTRSYNFTTSKTAQFAVLGSIKKGLSAQVIILLILLILGLAGAAFFLYRRAQKQNYQEYIRKKYYNL